STERYALFTATPLVWFYRITYPVMWLFNSITNGVMKMLGHDVANEHEVYTDEEIKLLIDESTESGLIDPEQNEYVDNIFDLGDKDAEAIMTPRTDVVCIDLDDPLEESLQTVLQYKYTRYPVCRGSKDRIVGFVHVKDLYTMPKDATVDDLRVRMIQAVPEGVPIAKLLQTLQEKRTKIAVVIDEHGGTAGIVTMSDIMEQIVGRIDDEYVHDTDDDIEELPDGTYQINGTLAIDDLVELLGFEPEEANDVETAGGLLLSLFDRIPKEGDVAVLEDRGTKVTFTVLAMDRLRIDRICMAIDRPDEE
ncbi:hemolysin family protein, partial [Adlercreutzia sp.]|uniref:hemolysin family protein n=1 Tax=Adlercreutzia sp. TaxID=1872387 RepID=UPI003AF0EA0C